MRRFLLLLLAMTSKFSAPFTAAAQTTSPERVVIGQSIESRRDPVARLRFASSFKYAGGQRRESSQPGAGGAGGPEKLDHPNAARCQRELAGRDVAATGLTTASPDSHPTEAQAVYDRTGEVKGSSACQGRGSKTLIRNLLKPTSELKWDAI
jgi:hypothetical protein